MHRNYLEYSNAAGLGRAPGKQRINIWNKKLPTTGKPIRSLIRACYTGGNRCVLGFTQLGGARPISNLLGSCSMREKGWGPRATRTSLPDAQDTGSRTDGKGNSKREKPGSDRGQGQAGSEGPAPSRLVPAEGGGASGARAWGRGTDPLAPGPASRRHLGVSYWPSGV